MKGDKGDPITSQKMGTAPVGRLLLSMSWPAMLSMMIQALYNVVDTLFISYTGEAGLTAITLAQPVQMMMIALGVGTGIGTNSLIARRLGAQQFDDASRAASVGLKLAFFNWSVFVVFGFFFTRPFMALFTENAAIIEQGTAYLRIVSIGCLFSMLQISSEKILQSTGNMILPMMTSLIGAVTNIALDPILIFGLLGAPKMGIAGAAAATVIGQAAAMTVVLTMLLRGGHDVRIDWRTKMDRRTLSEIYAVGGPAILMQAMASVLNLGMNAVLSRFSDTAVAIMGVYGRMQSFIFMPVFGINQGSTPVFGYNYGARDRGRLMHALRFAILMAAVIMGIGLVLFQTMPQVFLHWFNASATMMKYGVPAFRIISLCFVPAAFGIVSSGFFSACGCGVVSLIGSLLRQLVGALPLAVLFAWLGGIDLVWWCFPAAEGLGIAYYAVKLRSIYRRDISRLDGDASQVQD